MTCGEQREQAWDEVSLSRRSGCSLTVVSGVGRLRSAACGEGCIILPCAWKLQGTPVSEGTWRHKVIEQVKLIDH